VTPDTRIRTRTTYAQIADADYAVASMTANAEYALVSMTVDAENAVVSMAANAEKRSWRF